jgi:hypothetical protein
MEFDGDSDCEVAAEIDILKKSITKGGLWEKKSARGWLEVEEKN